MFLKRIYPKEIKDIDGFKVRGRTEDGEFDIAVDDGKIGQRLILKETDKFISGDVSNFTGNHKVGYSTYEKMFDYAKAKGKIYKPDHLIRDNTYRYFVNAMKYRNKGNSLSNIMMNDEKLMTDKLLAKRLDTIIREFESGEKMRLSDIDVKAMKKFIGEN